MVKMNDICILDNVEINGKFKDMAKTYEEIANIAEKMVYEIYMYHKKMPEFPIDIEMIAKYLGIKIDRKSLNRDEHKSFRQILGIITYQNGELEVTIDNDVSYKTQRYAIANAVGRFLTGKTDTFIKHIHAIPLIPQSLEEVTADCVALFLLLPIKTFKDEFLRYLDSCGDKPLDVDAWMVHLENKSQISQFNLAIGYQQLKQAMCYQKQLQFKENGFDVFKMKEDESNDIFA